MTGEDERAQSPADAAREALRAARERREAEREAGADGEVSGGGSARAEVRPGDAARAALRRAAAASGTDADTGSEARADAGSGADAGEGATAGANSARRAAEGAAVGPSPARRAAEGAREALRAALEERRRAAEKAAREGRDAARRPRRAAPSGAAGERTGGGEAQDTAAQRAHEVRRLVAGAFRMPSWDEGDDAERRDDPGRADRADDTGRAGRTDDPGRADRADGAGRAGRADGAGRSDRADDTGRTGRADSAGRAGRADGAGRVGHSSRVGPSGRADRPGDADDLGSDLAPASRTDSTIRAADDVPPAERSRTPTPAPDPAPPATPQVPRSMAAPGRDGELRRTFPAFAPRPADDAGFAETWWGNAWVAALEEGALDVKRLARGRGYAQEGHVDAITVTPGLVLAYVRGSRPRPYRVQVRLRTLGDDDWARFLDAVTERPAHIAALLDKEMPQSLAEGDVPLLPGPGDLDPRCSCPDRGHPCKHAAALCYQTARLLDADPFVLFLLRGRGERELLDALSRRNAARAARAAQEREPAPLAGVRATEALSPERRLAPLPPPLPALSHPEQPPVYPAAPGGPDPFALDQLATDAAARAHTLLQSGRDPVGGLTLWQDAVRLAAARPGSGLTASSRALYASLASAAGRTTADLARAVAAWRQGGLEGLSVLEEPWDPPAGRFDRARPLLLAADLPAFRPWRNHLTHPRGHVQLRLGRDGVWYPYESEPGRDDWWPRGTPDLDPVGALTGLGAAQD
ncbi:SWIM zinc finger family protein [Streptomyces nigra]|uniref:SWIM zinc finger family protein n=1 Tax=Streptomyces nigra TaxID=1827580 RepID=UPI00382D69E6